MMGRESRQHRPRERLCGEEERQEESDTYLKPKKGQTTDFIVLDGSQV